jgi:hypothetical protein
MSRTKISVAFDEPWELLADMRPDGDRMIVRGEVKGQRSLPVPDRNRPLIRLVVAAATGQGEPHNQPIARIEFSPRFVGHTLAELDQGEELIVHGVAYLTEGERGFDFIGSAWLGWRDPPHTSFTPGN